MHQFINFLKNFFNKHQALNNIFLMVFVTIAVFYNSFGASFSEVDDLSPNAYKQNYSLIYSYSL